MWEELLQVELTVHNVSVVSEGLSLTYLDICAKWNKQWFIPKAIQEMQDKLIQPLAVEVFLK